MSESGTMSSGLFGRRRPEGTRRRQLEWITNFALVVVSLFGISVGAGLIVFYKMDHFGFIAWQFTYIPWILLGTPFTLLVHGLLQKNSYNLHFFLQILFYSNM